MSSRTQEVLMILEVINAAEQLEDGELKELVQKKYKGRLMATEFPQRMEEMRSAAQDAAVEEAVFAGKRGGGY